MDVGTGLALFGSAKLAEKLLGPTVDYLGAGLKDRAQKTNNNLKNIFSSAIKKVKNLDDGCQVSPRTLKNIISEGAFCEDRLTAEYFGGVLASSRSAAGRDDRGVVWSILVSRLSVYEIRTHYLIYRTIRQLFSEQDFHFNIDDRDKLEIFMPYDSYFEAMEFSKQELEQIGPIINHTFFNLCKEELIENFLYGPAEKIKKRFPDLTGITKAGIKIIPSSLGAQFYLWVHGLGQTTIDDLLKTEFPPLEGIQHSCKAYVLETLRNKPSP